jgi:hypothetical protein
MIDPTSIASLSASLVVACGKISQHISTCLNKVDDVDTTLLVLKVEIDSLAAALGSISVKFNDSTTAAVVLQSLTGYEEEFWGNVKRSLNDCGVTLGTLEQVCLSINQGQREQVFQSIKQGERRFIRSATIQTRLERKSVEITMLKQHITAYHKAMGLTLQLISVYCPLFPS